MLEFAREFWDFARERKKLWLLPIIAALLLLSWMIFVAQGSAVAPFIYSLF